MSFDAVRFLREYGILYDTEGPNCAPGWINIKCPIPNCNDHSNHGGFNIDIGYYNCWKCGRHNLNKVIRYLLGTSYEESKKIIQEYEGHTLIVRRLNKKVVKKIKLPGGPLEKSHHRYLKERGLNSKFIEKKYKLQGTGPVGDWKFRIIMPIFFHNKLVAFQSRDITEKRKIPYKQCDKYIINPKHLLYGLDECRGREQIGIVEGPFDLYKIGDGFVCSFGSSMSEYQIKLLINFRRVFFLFDPESEALERAEKYAIRLASFGVETEVIDLEKDYDLGEFSPEEVKEVRRELGFEIS